MGLRDRLKQNPTPQTEAKVLSFDDDKYLFIGTRDGTVLPNSVLLSPEKKKALATHYKSVTGKVFDPELVPSVRVIKQTLQPMKWIPDDGVKPDDADVVEVEKFWWVPEKAYDETEIAELVTKDGPLFLQMMAVGYEVLGLTSEQPDSGLLDALLAGN